MEQTQGATTSAAVGLGRKRLQRAEHLLATIVSDFARELVRPLELRDAIGHFAAPQPFHRVCVWWSEKWGAQPLGHSLGGAVLHQRGPWSRIENLTVRTNFAKKKEPGCSNKHTHMDHGATGSDTDNFELAKLNR